MLRSHFMGSRWRGFSFFEILVLHLRCKSAVFCKMYYWWDPNEQVPTPRIKNLRISKRPTDYARSDGTYLTCITYPHAHPFNIGLIAAKRDIILIYKHHINMNHTMDQLHQPEGMWNDCWRKPMSAPQSPDCGDRGAITGPLHKSFPIPPGWYNCHIWGTWLFLLVEC